MYCLGYGESALCTPPPVENSGTWQYWNILGQVAHSQNQPSKSASSLADRLRWKVGVLRELQARGIWLQDASPLGLYLGRGKRVDPRLQAQLIRDSYRRWVWPSVEDDAPEQIWVIGKGVLDALSHLPGIDSARMITQPQDRVPGRHRAGLLDMASALQKL